MAMPLYCERSTRPYYNKKTEEAGGLMEESLWYVDPACKEKILQTFTAQEEEEPVFSYELSLSE